jgi:hypothetical protein
MKIGALFNAVLVAIGIKPAGAKRTEPKTASPTYERDRKRAWRAKQAERKRATPCPDAVPAVPIVSRDTHEMPANSVGTVPGHVPDAPTALADVPPAHIPRASAHARQEIQIRDDDGGDVRATAHQISDEIWKLLGFDLAFVPPNWTGLGGAIEAGLRSGWKRETIIEAVADVIKRRRGKPPPEHWRYLLKPIANAHAALAALPQSIAEASVPERKLLLVRTFTSTTTGDQNAAVQSDRKYGQSRRRSAGSGITEAIDAQIERLEREAAGDIADRENPPGVARSSGS